MLLTARQRSLLHVESSYNLVGLSERGKTRSLAKMLYATYAP